MATVGSPIYDALSPPLRDYAGNALTGKVIGNFAVAEAYLLSIPATTASVSLSETGGGGYVFSFVPTAVGAWAMHIVYNDGTTFREYGPTTYQVDASPASSVPASTGTFSTLADLRSAVARMCEDWIRIDASDTGSTSTIISAYQGIEADHHYRGSELLCISATNLANVGLKRRASDSDPDTLSISLSQELPGVILSGDHFDAFNIGGIGTTIATYDATINDVIRGLGSGARQFIFLDMVDVWDRQSPVIAIPDAFTHVGGVRYVDTDGQWQSVPGAWSGDGDRTDGWRVDTVAKTINVTGTMSDEMHGRAWRIDGATGHGRLAADTDATDIHYDFLVNEASARIMLRRPDQISKNMGGSYKNIADSLRAMAVMPTPNGFVRVR